MEETLETGDRIKVYTYDEKEFVLGTYAGHKPVPAIGVHEPILHFIADGEKYERFIGRVIKYEKIDREGDNV